MYQENMDFTDVLKVHLAAKHLLQFLGWNDLLRLRRVCKQTKTIIEDLIRSNPDRAPEIEVDEGNQKTFDAFMAMKIPTTKLFVNNPSGYKFYKANQPGMNKFLNTHGKNIKHLRVTEISIKICYQERDFIEALENLTSLEAGCVSYGEKIYFPQTLQLEAADSANHAKKDPRCIQDPMPIHSLNLDVLIFGQKKDIEFYSIPKTITQLRYYNLLCAGSYGMSQEALLKNRHLTLNISLNFLKKSISENPLNFVEKSAIRFYDFKGLQGKNIAGLLTQHPFQIDWLLSPLFLEICNKSLQKDVKLLNVNCLWFCQRYCSAPENASPELGLPVVSMVNIHPYVLTLNMSNLEKITIPNTFACIVGYSPRSNRPEWPSLKILDINVDENTGMCWDFIGKTRFEDINTGFSQPTSYLFTFLFRDIVRSSMTELRLQFEGNDLPIPKLEHIAASCPNLKKLKLRNWPGTNKALISLWSGLNRLEEVSLEYCKNLGNVAFVGSDVNNPVFLGLKNLKKLSLKGLDQMPKITDTLFILVLGQMKLSHLILTSNVPLKTVTQTGISSLLESPFAQTIKYFPFSGWTLTDMTVKQFNRLERQFRSYDML